MIATISVDPTYKQRLDPITRFAVALRSFPPFDQGEMKRLLTDFDAIWARDTVESVWIKAAVEVSIRLPALLNYLEKNNPQALRVVCNEITTPNERDNFISRTAKRIAHFGVPKMTPQQMSDMLIKAFDTDAARIGGGDATLRYRVELTRKLLNARV